MSSLRARSLTDLATFTRASTAMYVNALGVLASAAEDTPRIDYDPITLTPRGLLIEEARTNLLLRSESVATSPWTRTRMNAPSTNAAIAPDGTLTADQLVEDTT